MKKKIFLIGILFGLGLFANVFSQIPTNGLVGYWPFNGNALDKSGKNNNGTVYGAMLVNDRFGDTNSAYYFNGINSYIALGDSTSLNPQNAITLCAWYKAIDFTGGGYSAIIDKGYTSHVSPCYQYKLGAGGDYSPSNGYYFAFSVTTNNVESRILTNKNFWTSGNWYFLVGTYDGSHMKFYVNNQLIQSIPVTGLISKYNTPIFFGNNTTANDFLKGTIDDIRIYNRALDSNEIAHLYLETITSNNELTKSDHIKIYYNPSSNFITIENKNNQSVSCVLKLINIQGQEVFNENIKFADKYKLDLTNVNNGIYLLIIQDEKKQIVHKIMVQ